MVILCPIPNKKVGVNVKIGVFFLLLFLFAIRVSSYTELKAPGGGGVADGNSTCQDFSCNLSLHSSVISCSLIGGTDDNLCVDAIGTDTDTNASTECAGKEALLGDGSCATPLFTGENETFPVIGVWSKANWTASFSSVDTDYVLDANKTRSIGAEGNILLKIFSWVLHSRYIESYFTNSTKGEINQLHVNDINISSYLAGQWGGIMDMSGDPWYLTNISLDIGYNISADTGTFTKINATDNSCLNQTCINDFSEINLSEPNWTTSELASQFNTTCMDFACNLTENNSIISCSQIEGGSDDDFCADATGGAGSMSYDNLALTNISEEFDENVNFSKRIVGNTMTCEDTQLMINNTNTAFNSLGKVVFDAKQSATASYSTGYGLFFSALSAGGSVVPTEMTGILFKSNLSTGAFNNIYGNAKYSGVKFDVDIEGKGKGGFIYAYPVWYDVYINGTMASQVGGTTLSATRTDIRVDNYTTGTSAGSITMADYKATVTGETNLSGIIGLQFSAIVEPYTNLTTAGQGSFKMMNLIASSTGRDAQVGEFYGTTISFGDSNEVVKGNSYGSTITLTSAKNATSYYALQQATKENAYGFFADINGKDPYSFYGKRGYFYNRNDSYFGSTTELINNTNFNISTGSGNVYVSGDLGVNKNVFIDMDLIVEGYAHLTGGYGDIAETYYTNALAGNITCKNIKEVLFESEANPEYDICISTCETNITYGVCIDNCNKIPSIIEKPINNSYNICITNENYVNELEAGDVVCGDGEYIKKCDEGYSTLVYGVISEEANLIITHHPEGYPVAEVGTVKIKVKCGNPIYVGDNLVSTNNGMAQAVNWSLVYQYWQTNPVYVLERTSSPFAIAQENCLSGEGIITAKLK